MQVIKVGDGIGFCPKPNTSHCERLIAQIEDRFLIVEHLNTTPLIGYPQCMPLSDVDNLVKAL